MDPAEWGLYWFYDLLCVIDLGFSCRGSITIRTKTGIIVNTYYKCLKCA